MDIGFPLKGWDTNHPRNMQPDGTSADLLNVVPFDRDFRGRGSIRPGLSKFSPVQLGSGTQPVLLVSQVTRALDPSTVVPATMILNEPFAAADGTDVNGANWRTAKNHLGTVFPVTDNADTTGNLKILSNSVVVQSTGGSFDVWGATYKPSLALGVVYIIECEVHIDSSQVTNDSNLGVMIRINKNTYANQGIRVVTNAATMDIRNADGSVSANFAYASTLATGWHTLQVRVSGDVIAGWLDGVRYCTVTTTLNNTQVGFGICVGRFQNVLGIRNLKVYTGSPLAAARETDVVAVCGQNIYVGTGTTLAVASGGAGVVSEVVKPQMASRAGVCYITDGLHNLKQLDLALKTVSDIVPSTGSETAATLGANTLACVWRDRLVLAAPAATPQNFFMSRQGDATDWDYGQTDAGAAVAGNASRAGAIGEPLNCLIPWTDDVLILGGDHSIYKVEGDLAAGGQILLVSDSVGTLGPDCWDSDPSGNVYFVGSGGLYQMSPAGLPVNLANDTVKNLFVNINRATTYVVLTWDRDRNGLHIHLTPVNSGPATHVFYDATTQGFFPVKYPDAVGPVTAVVFDGDGPLDRQLLIAGRDGYIRKVDPASLTDDGTAITSYVMIGPFRPAGDAALSVLEALEVILGDAPNGFAESDFQMSLSVVTGKDAYTALTSPEKTVAFSFTKQARRKRLLQRISGGSFYFKISGVAGKLWSFEKLIALFTEGGLQRRY
jgi:hypothetical protein